MAADSQLVGHTLGHYRIVEQIGAGGMGVVYRAHDEHLERDVAIKVLPVGTLADETARKKFRKEALALAKLNHPNIATIFEFSSQNSTDYLVTEYIPGQTLDEKLAAGALSEKEVVALAIQLAQGLSAAHEHDIVHRDLKPANLRLTSDGWMKILDFGLAQFMPRASELGLTATLTQSHEVTGTLPYMAPEQLRGQPAEARTDIWAAGAVLYEMATAHQPFEEKVATALAGDIMHKTPHSPRKLRPELSPRLEAVILKCLEKEPTNRYQSARELQSDLERLRTGALPLAGRQRYWLLVAASAIVMVMLGVGTFLYVRRTPKLTEKDTIVLADFTNSTGDPVFDDTLKQGLAVQLGQSPLLNILPEQRVRSALTEMTRSPDAVVSASVAQEVCLRTGSKAFIAGSIANLGGQYVISLNATHCATGETLAREQTEALGKTQVLTALGGMATKLRNQLGESLSSIQKYDMPLAQATTASLEALKAYSFGLSKLSKGDGAGAVPLLQQAIDLDSDFAMAYLHLANAYQVQGPQGSERMEEAFRKAFALRNRASEREKFEISASYSQFVTSQAEDTIQICELWAQTYPRDFTPHRILGFENGVLGRHERSAEEFQKAMELDPSQALPYAGLMFGYMALNRLADARTVYRKAQEHKVDFGHPTLRRYELAFLEGDKEMMTKLSVSLAGQPGFETLARLQESQTEAYFGHLGRARELFRQAEDTATREAHRFAVTEIRADEAILEAQLGNLAEARKLAASAVDPLNGQAGMAEALAGDPNLATKRAERLASQSPANGSLNKMLLPRIRAAIELKRSNPQRAVELLASATAYEASWFDRYLSAYLRGQAYLYEHRSQEAAAEFQKVLDHRGVVLNSVIGALSHLQVGRAYKMGGDTAKARAAYQDFLTLWKDADPDIPILKQVKAEYAKLQ